MHGTGWPRTLAIPPRIALSAGSSKRRKLAGERSGGQAADSKNATSTPCDWIASANATWPSTRCMRARATSSGREATSTSRFSNPTRLLAIENGPLTGTRTWVSGNCLASWAATSIAMGIRPSVRGLSGLRSRSSAAERQIGRVIAGMPVPPGLATLAP